MFSLYWKIFLGFWVTSLILGSGAVILSDALRQQSAIDMQGLTPLKLVDRSVFIVRRLPDEIDEWKIQLAANDIHFHVAYEQKSPLSTPLFNDNIQQMIDALDTSIYQTQSSVTRLRIGRKERSITGEQIRFVLDMPGTNILKAKAWVNDIGVQFTLGLVLSALVCFVLARYLTRNIKQLSIATRALASGDLSARAKLFNLSKNDELSQLGLDFNDMATALETSLENQKRLVRDISHELRSPLARLQIALEIARQKDNSKELDRIEKEANRLNELIGQLLSMPDDSAPLSDTIDLTELLESIIDDCTIEAEVKHVNLSLHTDCQESLVAATVEQLHSAMENIIRNAIHYTANNSQVTIDLSLVNIPNTESENQAIRHTSSSYFQVSINDCGPGVPKDDLDQIFQPFYRVDRARNRDTGGYGIGLAIVQRVIQRHKGSVSAKNTGAGLSVQILLPVMESD
jgi:two-component system sensor histidine kinase CpxA